MDKHKIENIIHSLSQKQIAVVHDLMLPQDFSQALQDFEACYQSQLFKSAGIGSGQNKSIRSDLIYWWSQESLSPAQSLYWQFLKELTNSANQNFFCGINDCEQHYALYEAQTYYQRHIDQPQGSQARVLTTLFYLNENWSKSDGGQLVIYNPEKPDHILYEVEPRANTFVCFLSNVFEHEVKTSHTPRKSLSGWLRRR